MAVRTNEIAFRNLKNEVLGTAAVPCQVGDVSMFDASNVIEVEDVGWVSGSAIQTRLISFGCCNNFKSTSLTTAGNRRLTTDAGRYWTTGFLTDAMKRFKFGRSSR
jgi:hypothetical protein